MDFFYKLVARPWALLHKKCAEAMRPGEIWEILCIRNDSSNLYVWDKNYVALGDRYV